MLVICAYELRVNKITASCNNSCFVNVVEALADTWFLEQEAVVKRVIQLGKNVLMVKV